MGNSRLILFAAVVVCVAGCSAVPYFSSHASPPNPVPKPDGKQGQDEPKAPSTQGKSSDKTRTPSVVWLPESRIAAKSSATHQNRVTDSAGQPILTTLSDCIRPGYSLLDATECGADPDSKVEADTGSIVSESNGAPRLDTDLLGGIPQPNAVKPLSPSPSMADSSPAAEGAPRNIPDGISQNAQAQAPTAIQTVSIPSSRLLPARYERIVLSSDLVFEFAKFGVEGLSAAGQSALRGLRERFAKYDPTSFRKVVITGHADRLGKPKSNVAISQQRAAAIKSFLISTGIDTDILEAVGVGSVSPVAHCTGKRKSAKLKFCLAPNRRVEIEIIGAT